MLTQWCALLLIVIVHAKTVVHSTKPALHPVAEVKETSSRYHVSANLMDLTQRVIELPEQTIPTHHRKVLADLEEEDAQDPIKQVQEIPEQSLEDDTQSSAQDYQADKPTLSKGRLHDLETSRRHQASSDDDEQFAADEQLVDEDPADDDGAKTKIAPVNQAIFDGVTSDLPHTKEEIQPSTGFGTPRQFLTKGVKNARNPYSENHNPPIGMALRSDNKVDFDSDAHRDEGIKFKSGGYEINIQHNHAKNFLDASRVQVGTSYLGPHDDTKGKVARFRVRFMNPFKKRPVVFVTTVPEGAEHQHNVGPHPDVFAASVAEIRLDSFVVHVIRVDQSGWGQKLYLDWIAMEYDSDYPKATKGGNYLMTHPHFADLEHEGEGRVNAAAAKESSGVVEAQNVHIPVMDDEWDQ